MKKTLLAAALLAGFAGAANAQSNVTLYGIVDAGFLNDKTEGSKAINGINSGLGAQSRWGIRGSEDIGNGLKAIFQLESGFDVDTGISTQQNRLFGRYAFVGLESARAGRLTLGRTTNLGFMWPLASSTRSVCRTCVRRSAPRSAATKVTSAPVRVSTTRLTTTRQLSPASKAPLVTASKLAKVPSTNRKFRVTATTTVWLTLA